MKRHPNPRLAKIHRTYSVSEIANDFGVHKNTVRSWFRNGLPTIDKRRPVLVHGRELRAFLEAKRTKNRQTCANGEIYCVGCRAPRVPADGMVDYEPTSSKVGNLVGLCPQCSNVMYRKVNAAKLHLVAENLDIKFREAVKD